MFHHAYGKQEWLIRRKPSEACFFLGSLCQVSRSISLPMAHYGVYFDKRILTSCRLETDILAAGCYSCKGEMLMVERFRYYRQKDSKKRGFTIASSNEKATISALTAILQHDATT